jgi:hypothetical protein
MDYYKTIIPLAKSGETADALPPFAATRALNGNWSIFITTTRNWPTNTTLFIVFDVIKLAQPVINKNE